MNDLKKLFSIELLNNHFPALHGMRSLAILLVIQYHVTSLIPYDFLGDYRNISLRGWFGMDLFFILSGFLIGYILLHEFEEKAGGNFYLRFYLRRAFRIFPLYYVCLILLIVIIGWIEPLNKNIFYEIFYLTSYLEHNDYYMTWSWSLSVEEHFYVLAPIVLFFLLKIQSHRLRFVFLLSVWLLPIYFRLSEFYSQETWGGSDFYYKIYMPSHMRIDEFVTGIFLAYLRFYFHEDMIKLVLNKFVRISLLLTPALLFVFILSPWDIDGFQERTTGVVTLKEVFELGTLTSIAYGCLIMYVLYYPSILQRFTSAKIFQVFASLGYGIYLVHALVLYKLTIPFGVFIKPMVHWPDSALWLVLFLFTVTLSVLSAYILHLLVEKPALRLRDRYVS